MSESPDKFREQLLAQNEPTQERRIQYEKETQAMLNQLEAGFRREKWGTGILWIYATIFMTAALLITGYRNQVQPEILILAFAFTLLIGGGIELIKHFINRSRVKRVIGQSIRGLTPPGSPGESKQKIPRWRVGLA